MKIDFNQELRTISGTPLKDPDGKPITLKWACTEALLAAYPKEEATGADKIMRFKLAHLIEPGGTHDLKSEQVVELKKLADKWTGMITSGTLIYGQMIEMLEPSE